MKEATYIEFDKYLNNELSSFELDSFNSRLKTDSEFKEEFEIYKALESSLGASISNKENEIELRNTLSNLGSKYIKEEAPKKNTKVISLFNYRKLMVAASIALLIGFFLFKDANPVYTDYSKHTTLELVVRSGNNDLFVKAEEAFNSKNYEEALKHLTTLSNIYLNDTEVLLYKGICQLELSNYFEANAIFEKIRQGNSSLADTATWYKALTLLKQEKFMECKQILKTIPESSDQIENAKKLLKKL